MRGWILCLALLASCAPPPQEKQEKKEMTDDTPKAGPGLATFAGGCFWCVEAIFENVEGVESVVSGYSGGHVDDPSYEEICGKLTGHAEACQIKYDPSKVDYSQLLEIFFRTHDPTTKNRQGYDVGPQYRSVVFYHDDKQKGLAETAVREINAEGIYNDPIVTEISKFEKFWEAEADHQNYFRLNRDKNPYCQAVIVPKLEKFKKLFKDKLKKQEASQR